MRLFKKVFLPVFAVFLCTVMSALIVGAANTENGDANILTDENYGKVAADMEVSDVPSIVPSDSIFKLSTSGTITAEQKHNGEKSLLIGSNGNAVISVNASYCNTSYYTFSAWIKTVDATGTITLFSKDSTTNAAFSELASIDNGTKDWTKYSIKILVPEDKIADLNAVVEFGLQGVTGGKVYLDDLELSQPAEVSSDSSGISSADDSSTAESASQSSASSSNNNLIIIVCTGVVLVAIVITTWFILRK